MYKEIDEYITSKLGSVRTGGPRAGAVGQRAVEEGLGRGGGRGGGPRASAEEGHGRARWRPHEEEDGGAGVTEGEPTRREVEEEAGRRCSTRKKTSRSICQALEVI
jgi:hypothetical protein